MANVEAYGTNIVGSGSSGGGGLTQQEHEWLESLASMPALGDINPDKAATTAYIGAPSSGSSAFPVKGYDKIAVYWKSSKPSPNFIDSSGTVISAISMPSSASTWSDYIDIPSNATYVQIASGSAVLYYSLLTADSSYNPDNQT